VVIVLVNSFPNLVEAIIGTLILTGIGMAIRKLSTNAIHRVSNSKVYLVASLVAGLYVVTQELNWYNFRGPNVMDRYDIAASLLGLVIVNRMLSRYGFTNDIERLG
jgi:predicted tellurium resistance membrane protein TerC